ncbi:MAG: C_GCAxxG_C_C family protein [Acidobacteria bacterium]|nr:C_GCAxxG_C_C family protein [Acidobacteriota bacterium]
MDISKFQSKLQELEKRNWDRKALESRCNNLMKHGIPAKTLNRDVLTFNRQEILDRVQRRAEEYNFILRNCAQSTGLALMEEFGLGNIEIVRALSPFPGFGGTGWMCGAVTGSLIAFGLQFGSDDLLNEEGVRASIGITRQFMPRFEKEVGAVTCPQIQENVVFGRYMDPAAGPENMEAFEQAKGFEKCSLVPGIGARIAADIIIEAMADI